MAKKQFRGISFIIPAFNEEHCIVNAINSIKLFIKKDLYEIIVVDNGSTDNTFLVSKQNDVNVIKIKRVSISEARNFGAAKAKYPVLAFIDADVRLTSGWFNCLDVSYQTILNSRILTGARYAIREKPSWLEKHWFKPLSDKNVNYINGGNIILSKESFSIIGKFDTSLITGEDYEFSMRANSKGIQVINNIGFNAIHDGYPQDIRNFCRRERWHGKGDLQSFKTILNSKVALSSLFFGTIHITAIVLFFLGHNIFFILTLLLMLTITTSMSFYIFNHSRLSTKLINIFVCYLYLISRSSSIFNKGR